MAQKTKRTERLLLRVTPAEKALIEEAAKAAGLKVSEFIRHRAGIGNFGRAALRGGSHEIGPPGNSGPRRVPSLTGPSAVKDHPDYQARVSRAAMRMPRRAAENVVRKEMEREAAP